MKDYKSKSGPLMKLTVEKVVKCPGGYEEGDEWTFRGLRTPEISFCGRAYYAIFPWLMTLNFGGNKRTERPGVLHTACPENGQVVFRIERLENP